MKRNEQFFFVSCFSLSLLFSFAAPLLTSRLFFLVKIKTPPQQELRHGKVGVTILPFDEATVAAEERGDDDEEDDEDSAEPGYRFRVAQRYLKDTMLSSSLGGDCALRAWVLVRLIFFSWFKKSFAFLHFCLSRSLSSASFFFSQL